MLLSVLACLIAPFHSNAEQNGIVFIDEIDKIGRFVRFCFVWCSNTLALMFPRFHSASSNHRGPDASAEGVQRDLLPLIEGSIVNTKCVHIVLRAFVVVDASLADGFFHAPNRHGNVATDHILFIASGAFHSVKPSDLLPELQGRLPIRVQLNGLTEQDMRRILTEPESNLVMQQEALISTEGVTLTFTDDAISQIAHMAAEMNRTVENIGARRLQTVMERLVEDVSFEAADMEKGSEVCAVWWQRAGLNWDMTKHGAMVFQVVIDVDLVKERLGDMLKQSDLSKFIL